MPAKGWRKPTKPIDGPLREALEQWLDNGGYDELKRLLIPEFGPNTHKATSLVHTAVARAMSQTMWRGFDPTKRKADAVGSQMRMILWQTLINYRRDNYGKQEPYSLTGLEGEQYDIATFSHTQTGAHIDLERAVESLPVLHRQVFTMIASEGYTVKEVACILNRYPVEIEDMYDAARLSLHSKLKAYAHSD